MNVQLKPSHENFPEDVSVIQDIVINHGYECNRLQAKQLWEAYSESLCAGWLILDGFNDTAIWDYIEPFIEDMED